MTGGAATAVTTPGHDLSGFKLSPAGDKLLVWADRRPNAPSLQQPTDKKDPNAGSGRTYDQLFVRHWDAWADGSRSQLFVLPLADGKAAGDGVAIEGGLIGDTPSKPFGGGDELSWSADGKSVFFALREAGRIESLSTNLDIFQAAADGSAPPVNLTAANRATDTLPAASPDGKWLAYVAMKRPGYESDRTVLQLRDLATGQVRAVTEDWDVSIESIDWSADSRTLYVTAHDTMDKALFRLDPNTGAHVRLTGAGTVAAVALMPKGGAVVALDTMAAPDDLWRVRGKAADPADRRQRRPAGRHRHAAGDPVQLSRRRRRHGVGLGAEACRARRRGQGAGRLPGPWRSAGDVGRRLVVSLEPGDLRLGRLRYGDGRLPRLDQPRPGFRRRDQQ